MDPTHRDRLAAARTARASGTQGWRAALAAPGDAGGVLHALLLRYLREDGDGPALAAALDHTLAAPGADWWRARAAAERWLGREAAHLDSLGHALPAMEQAATAARMGDVWWAAELADPRAPAAWPWYRRAGVLAEHRPDLPAVDAPPLWHAEQHIALGDFGAARALLDGLDDGAAAAWRARLALWAGRDPLPALAHPGVPEAVRTELAGGWAVLQGRHGDAIAGLEPGAGHGASAVHLAWLAEAHMRAGRADVALQHVGRARAAQREDSIPLLVLEHWIRRPDARPPRQRPDVRRLIEAVWAPDTPPRRHALRASLERLGGHRGAGFVLPVDGGVQRRPMPLLGNIVGSRLRSIVRTRGYASAKAAFAAVHARQEQAEARIYEGELDLWFGDYDAAGRTFRRAIALEPDTKWAWIGLGACALLQGDAAGAVDLWARRFRGAPTLPFRLRLRNVQSPGPTLWIYLAEAHWRLGQRERAMATAGACIRDKPRRLSALLLIARLAAEEGDDTLLRDALESVAQRVPGLGLAARLGEGSPTEAHDRLLAAWRGNRSSQTLTWRRGAALDSHSWSGPEAHLLDAARARSEAAWRRFTWSM